MQTIRNPIEWGNDALKQAATALTTSARAMGGTEEGRALAPPVVRRIEVTDLREVLAKGFSDFGACRTDVIFLCLVYPIAGLILARAAFGADLLPLLFPLASGFALIGPVAGVGLYEMSRRRERGEEVSWAAAFGVVGAPSFGSIIVLALALGALFVLWLVAAQIIYNLTLGPAPPASIEAFLRDVFLTGAGWTMIVVGMGVGFLFAVAALAISVVSFPMLVDRGVSLGTAVGTSIRAVTSNLVPMAAWGLIVAAGLVLASIPFFVGLIVVMPVLGHATWHLYRKVVAT
ncbi:MAG TPA: DUF2189 domain-containing protein [Vineibacter sp.]|nr:DUF2189 domain-containing protein [Vineibacter sp.]